MTRRPLRGAILQTVTSVRPPITPKPGLPVGAASPSPRQPSFDPNQYLVSEREEGDHTVRLYRFPKGGWGARMRDLSHYNKRDEKMERVWDIRFIKWSSDTEWKVHYPKLSDPTWARLLERMSRDTGCRDSEIAGVVEEMIRAAARFDAPPAPTPGEGA